MSVTCNREVLTYVGPKPALYLFHLMNMDKMYFLALAPGDSDFMGLG